MADTTGVSQLSFAPGDGGATFRQGLALAWRVHVLALHRQRPAAAGRRRGRSRCRRISGTGSWIAEPAAFDITHRTSQSVIYDLPFGKGRQFDIGNAVLNQVLGNWQVNAIFVTQTGLPFTPVLATSVSNAGGSRPDRLKSAQLDDPTINQWFDTSFNTPDAAWATPRQYTYGNAGRNILRGPGRTNLDFSVFKQFAITERYRVQFRAEFFNLFNHPQFDLPNTSIGSPERGCDFIDGRNSTRHSA